MTGTQNSYRDVVTFLIKFIGIYLIGNVLYGLLIEWYHPAPDPITFLVSQNVAWLLNFFNESVSLSFIPDSPYVRFIHEGQTIIRAFEGCNGVNVMIVYVSFLIAFNGNLKQTLLFLVMGLAVIYMMNLVRVGALFEVAFRFPSQLYFFHKYFFTGLLYAVVFILWYFWVKQTKKT